ncbi:hypothetical protein PIB30_031297 [Stylosanthes scabra]|uniref:P-loop containing nucleoside triphosphate hydrolases superfamily protein n=1 Tax=Stylosanthes scabra TaxID=79078 RepID=A0ABU6QBA9_9FABA|nr:hypothetical protein [Stylosanthes scabra]
MGGDSVVSHDQDSFLEEDFHLLSPHSPAFLSDNRVNVENGSDVGETGEVEDSTQGSSRFDFEVNERKRLNAYQEILQSYDQLKIDSQNLKDAKEKILSYKPGAWIENVGCLQPCHYDVPETTCLLLVGPRGSGKSSIINRISKVLEDDKFAPARAQVSYNSLTGDGTYFIQEYMIPRHSTSICLCDTRSLSVDSSENENNRMLKSLMTKGVRHGDLVLRKTDSQILKKSLKCKARKDGFISSKIRNVNFVIYVVNGLSVLKSMEDTAAQERQYIETIVQTFNSPLLSFKDDKPVLVFTHGDLLSLSDRARVRAYLGELLGIPPTKQIFDIPDCDDLATQTTIIEMLRYSLEHAERNFPRQSKVLGKVETKFLLCIVLSILLLAIAIAIAYDMLAKPSHVSKQQACPKKHHVRLPKLKVPEMEFKIDWYKIRHIW